MNASDKPGNIDPTLLNVMVMAFTRHEHLMAKSDESPFDFYKTRIQFEFDIEEQSVRDVVSSVYEEYLGADDDEWALTYCTAVLAFIIASQRAAADGNICLAWIYVSEAHYWAGNAAGLASNPDPKRVRSDLARKAAEKSHDETRKLKEEIVALWLEKCDPSWSNEQAAEFLKKYTPLKTRTLSRYVAEAKKK